jgi:formylglycine-generating enzyme required for sulfatase activity
MAAEIATWIDEAEMQVKLARELLRRELASWRELGKLIEPASFRLLHARREDLRRLDGEELELLFRSALAAGERAATRAAPYWAARAREGGVSVDAIAREGLRSDDFRTRAAVVQVLAQLGERFADDLIGMLDDEYPQVRVAAIQALEALRPDGAWRTHLVYECYVPAGAFIMGDASSKEDDEKPAHEVTLGAFYVGKYPVTNAGYKRYKNDVGQPFTIPEGKADHPVVSLSWYDARDYAAWAGMRLLTEAEWEKAASWEEEVGVGAIPCGRPSHGHPEGRKRTYPWGDEFDAQKCNTLESGPHMTTPVGKYSPEGDSPYGCADMAGNVWEWTSSVYEDYPYQADDGREDRSSSRSRVMRGGVYYSDADAARCACRVSYSGSRYMRRGVRVGVGCAEPELLDF